MKISIKMIQALNKISLQNQYKLFKKLKIFKNIKKLTIFKILKLLIIMI
jgi:hypothetical protein